MAGKAKKQTGCEKDAANIARHSTQCAVCNHKQKGEIERRYMIFVPVTHVADEFGLSDDSIYRHAEYFGLDDQRAGDTEKVLKNVIARGFSQHKNIDPRVALSAVQELNKMQGKHQEPMPNQNLSEDEKSERAAALINKGRERMRLVK
jgi:hypothetical protein